MSGSGIVERLGRRWLLAGGVAAAPAHASVGIRVYDIIASARKTVQPVVSQEAVAGGTVFTIGELAPNTVVDIEFACAPCERAVLDVFYGFRAKVTAQGSVTNADPRVSTLRRGAINLLRLAGQFH